MSQKIVGSSRSVLDHIIQSKLKNSNAHKSHGGNPADAKAEATDQTPEIKAKPIQAVGVRMSLAAEFISFKQGLDPQGQKSVDEFLNRVHNQLSGDLNNAPETIQAFAKEKGISIADLASKIAKPQEVAQGYGPMKPVANHTGAHSETKVATKDDYNMKDVHDALTPQERVEARDFFIQARRHYLDGTINAKDATYAAPEALKDIAKENGFTIEDMLHRIVERDTLRHNIRTYDYEDGITDAPTQVNGTNVLTNTADAIDSMVHVIMDNEE